MSHLNTRKLTVEITARDKAKVTDDVARGWEPEASQTNVTGKLVDFTIRKGESLLFSIRIWDDGTLCITDFAHAGYRIAAEQQIYLEPRRPWVKPKTRKTKRKPARKEPR